MGGEIQCRVPTRAELLTLIVAGLIGAAVFGPKLLRADIASDEAQAIADLRIVSRAEEAYAAANFGFYANVTRLCRSGPECRGIGIPGYPVEAPEFLPGELGRVSPYDKDGYSRTWTATVAPYHLPARADAESVVDYCYDAAPGDDLYPWDWSDPPHSFAVNGSGRLFVDPLSVPLPCPIPYGYHLQRAPRPALAVDFGRRGLWRYDGGGRWLRLTRSNPLVVRAWRSGLLATFEGRKGIYLLDDTGWKRIHRRTATEVVPLVDGLVAQFSKLPGLWHWDESTWMQVAPWRPEAMEAQGNKLLVDFGVEGLWLFWKPIGWTQLSDRDPSYIRAGRHKYFADVADGTGVHWLYVENLQENRVFWVDGVPAPEAVLEFQREIMGLNVAYDLGVEGGIELNREQVSPWDPYLFSRLDAELLAAFRGRGLYRFEDATRWVELTTSEPTELAAADGYVGALFEDLKGVYRFDDSGSFRIARWKAESVTAVDLAAASQSARQRRAARCPVRRQAHDDESCRRLAPRRGLP